MSPKWTLAETPRMPKSRYRIMTDYMPKVGTRGLDMMYRTATAQANLDFSSEADMVAEAARRPRAAAGDDGAVRQFAVHRGQAERAVVGALGNLARHRRRRAPACCRSRSSPAWASSATSITRSTCRCISSSAATVYHDVAGASFRDLLAGPARGAAGRARDDLRLGQPPVDDFPRGAAQALSRDARRRRRAAGAHRRAIGADGRALLRFARRSTAPAN